MIVAIWAQKFSKKARDRHLFHNEINHLFFSLGKLNKIPEYAKRVWEVFMIWQYDLGKCIDDIPEFYPPLGFVVIHEDWQQMFNDIDKFKVDACLQIQALGHQPQNLILQKNFLLDEEVAHADIAQQPDTVLCYLDIFWRFIAECDFILRKLVVLLTHSLQLIITSFDLLIAQLNAFSSLPHNVTLLFK